MSYNTALSHTNLAYLLEPLFESYIDAVLDAVDFLRTFEPPSIISMELLQDLGYLSLAIEESGV
jgi:hypothetical protein